MPSTKTSPRRTTLRANSSDELAARALEALPAMLASQDNGAGPRWASAWEVARERALERILLCDKLLANAANQARRKLLETHRAELSERATWACPPCPSKYAGFKLDGLDIGEVVASTKSRLVHSDLTLRIATPVVHHLDFGGKIDNKGWDCVPFDVRNAEAVEDSETWHLGEFHDPVKVFEDQKKEVWRFVVAPLDAGLLKVFTRLKAMMTTVLQTSDENKLEPGRFGLVTDSEALRDAAEQSGYRCLYVGAPC